MKWAEESTGDRLLSGRTHEGRAAEVWMSAVGKEDGGRWVSGNAYLPASESRHPPRQASK